MKLKKLAMHSSMLTMLLREGVHAYQVTQGGIPADAKIVNVLMPYMPQNMAGMVWLVLRSESFPLVTEGQEIPEYGPITVDTASIRF